MIQPKEIEDILVQNLGRELTAKLQDICPALCQLLDSFHLSHDSLRNLSEKVSDSLFQALYDQLGETMCFTDHAGKTFRVYLQAIDEIADHLLYPCLIRLPVTAASFSVLNQYALVHASFSAQKVIVEKYRDVLDPEEYSVRQKMVQIRSDSRSPAVMLSVVSQSKHVPDT